MLIGESLGEKEIESWRDGKKRQRKKGRKEKIKSKIEEKEGKCVRECERLRENVVFWLVNISSSSNKTNHDMWGK